MPSDESDTLELITIQLIDLSERTRKLGSESVSKLNEIPAINTEKFIESIEVIGKAQIAQDLQLKKAKGIVDKYPKTKTIPKKFARNFETALKKTNQPGIKAIEAISKINSIDLGEIEELLKTEIPESKPIQVGDPLLSLWLKRYQNTVIKVNEQVDIGIDEFIEGQGILDNIEEKLLFYRKQSRFMAKIIDHVPELRKPFTKWEEEMSNLEEIEGYGINDFKEEVDTLTNFKLSEWIFQQPPYEDTGAGDPSIDPMIIFFSSINEHTKNIGIAADAMGNNMNIATNDTSAMAKHRWVASTSANNKIATSSERGTLVPQKHKGLRAWVQSGRIIKMMHRWGFRNLPGLQAERATGVQAYTINLGPIGLIQMTMSHRLITPEMLSGMGWNRTEEYGWYHPSINRTNAVYLGSDGNPHTKDQLESFPELIFDPTAEGTALNVGSGQWDTEQNETGTAVEDSNLNEPSANMVGFGNLDQQDSNLPEWDGSGTGPMAYCVAHKGKIRMMDARRIRMRNGRPAYRGTCPIDGNRVFRIG